MSEAHKETPQIYPFQKVPNVGNPLPDSDSRPIYPFQKVAKDQTPKVLRSVQESVPSSESTPTAEQIESEIVAQEAAAKGNGTDSEQTEQAKTDAEKLENSSPTSSSPQSPGWNAPSAPVVPPTSD